MRLIIRLLKILKMLYPPKGAANADPEWGPIDFSYILLFRGAVKKHTWVFSFQREIGLFEIMKMFYCSKKA